MHAKWGKLDCDEEGMREDGGTQRNSGWSNVQDSGVDPTTAREQLASNARFASSDKAQLVLRQDFAPDT